MVRWILQGVEKMAENELNTDQQHIPEPGVEGVTIHIEPMSDLKPGVFVVRLAVNGRMLATDSVYGVVNETLPRVVARLLQTGAARYAKERPDWVKNAVKAAAVGAFRKLFNRQEPAS